MNEEHDGMDQGNPSEEEYQRFRKMMDGMGREGIRRMVEHLTERIEADPRDTEALSVMGLAYGELGEHRLAAEDYGKIIALDPGNAGAHLDRARAYARLRSTAWRWRTTTPPSAWPPATPWRTTAGGRARRSWATLPGR